MADEQDIQAAYQKARGELVAAIHKKRAIDRNLATLEANLYNFEGSYLQDTANSGGNIITGFESYLKTNTNTRRKGEMNLDNDRLFTNSSTTVSKALDLNGDEPALPPTPTMTTVSLGAPMGDLRRDSRSGRGQRKRTEDPEFIPPTASSSNRPGRPAKRQKVGEE
ncbi:hypothetical protein FRB94_008338 [Tulasnella sp. JGI-2019a]|nr:hypothetical protein FRB93_002347 [Tulasnella sp. JGI-2019a]KAG8996422.1 hypothetical protein FRB94_008338 [Tulasnella sp. JGI-2019a]KAG9037096.1 hypothetical protein FRB95_006951 [Tulasnella sp. JGI-2019a]